jgi:TonB-linked SusC/RagA family outer membrane protein
MKKLTTTLLFASFLLFLSLLSISVYSQVVIKGVVVNEKDNTPIQGATVRELNNSVSQSVTGENGTFSLEVKNPLTTLVISCIGFQTIRYPLQGSTNITVKLSETPTKLNELVVVGYTSQQKKDITGAIDVVNVNNLKSLPAGTLLSQLQGLASGVTVINSGAPGGGSNFRIRGITSLGNTDPLIIVDGVQVFNVQDINPYDIESIQVLKDAGSASIYGVRGSNGVILITTKHGVANKVNVNYNGYVGIQTPLSGNVWNIATPEEEANLIWEAQKNDGLSPQHPQYGNGMNPVLPDYLIPTGAKEGDPGTNPSDYVFHPGYPDDNRITRANKEGTDWFHAVFKNAIQHQHSISADGGSSQSNYHFSLEYLDQQGTLIYTYLKRYGIRMNSNFKSGKHIQLGENAYVYYKQNPGFLNQNENNAVAFSFREPPIIPIYDIKGNFAGTGAKGLSNSQNPYANQYRTKDNKSNDWGVLGNVYFQYNFLNYFTYKSQFGGNYDNYYYFYFSYTPYEDAELFNTPNSYGEGAGYNSTWTWTNTLNFQKEFNSVHKLNILLGTEAVRDFSRSMSATRTNYIITDPSYWELNTGSSNPTNSGSITRNTALFSLFGLLNYNFSDKYYLTGTIRRDGSSLLAPESRYGIFPSFSLGWRVSNETFFRKVKFISDFKLRGGWGKLGSLNNISATNAYDLFAQNVGKSYYDINGTSTSSSFGWYNYQFGNPKAKWEQDIISNLGFDAGLLKNNLYISFDWYKKFISGLLFPLSLPATAGGAYSPFVNLGNIQNTGLDISITYHANITRDLTFDLNGNITSYKNKIVKLPFLYQDYYSAGSSRLGTFTRAQVGHPIGAFFGYQVIGYFKDMDDVNKSPSQPGAAPGFFKYKDVNGDGKIDDQDRTFFGNPNPKLTYGFNLSAKYKRFDLSLFMYGVYGNDVINYVKYWTDFWQVFEGAVSKDAVYYSWKTDRSKVLTPILTTKANFSNTAAFNSWYMESGSYLRCKQITLGYSLPLDLLNRIGVSQFRIYFQVLNAFTITKYTGLDPELQGSNLYDNTSFGIDFGNYPNNQKAYLLGVTLNF